MRNRIELKNVCIFLFFVFVAYLMYLPQYVTGLAGSIRRPIRLMIQLPLLWVWCCSARRRVIHPSIRRYLTAIPTLMIFWLVVRHVKWEMTYPDSWEVYLWYLFYLPIIFIPLLLYSCAAIMRRNDDFRPSKSMYCLYGIGAVLFLLVLTNNLHEWAFVFIAEPASQSGKYHHGPVYMIILIWCVLCFGGALYHIIKRSKILKLRQGLVLMLLAGAYVLYAAAYLLWSDTTFFRFYLSDMTTVYCYGIILFFELCLFYRLIPNNTGYEALFSASYLHAAIEDAEGGLLVRSQDFDDLPADVRQKSCKESVLMGQYKVSSARVLDGRIYWHEDISRLLEAIDALQDVKLELEGSNELKKIEVDMAQKKQRILEMSRLYDRIQQETSHQIQRLSELVAAYDQTVSDEERLVTLKQMVVVGSYLKRRNNLLLLSEKSAVVPSSELMLCFRESMEALEASGVVTNLCCNVTEPLPIRTAMWLYDDFERLLEVAFPRLTAMVVHLDKLDGAYLLRINTDSAYDLKLGFADAASTVQTEHDGDDWYVQFRLPGGDEA